jgi:hypothetical protein
LENKYNFLISPVTHSARPFELIHSDVWGPAPLVSKGGNKYYVIFVYDHSRYTWIYFMKRRSELLSIYRSFARMIHTRISAPIKIFRFFSTISNFRGYPCSAFVR